MDSLMRGYQACARTQVFYTHPAQRKTSGSPHALGLPGPTKPPATAQETDKQGGLV